MSFVVALVWFSLELSKPLFAADSPCEPLLLRRVPVAIERQPLSRVVERFRDGGLAREIEASSDQRQPLYLGASPRELALGLAQAKRPWLRASMRELARRQAQAIRKSLGLGGHAEVELEAWPTQDDEGNHTWVFARYRKSRNEPWQWLEPGELDLGLARDEPAPMLPRSKRTWVKREFRELFTDVLEMKGLYDKPLFGDAVWTSELSGEVVAAWMRPARREAFRQYVEENPEQRLVSRIVPQPARFNEKPVTFVLRVGPEGVRFPGRIRWIADEKLPENSQPVLSSDALRSQLTRWPDDFDEAYRQDVLVLSGRQTAVFPASGRRVRFTRKNSIDSRNQLEALVDYLEERYAGLGLKTIRQRFTWRGIPQSNLVAIIPGRLKGEANRPVLLADHIDTAFAEDAFEKTGRRVSAPGADDNVTASAALLRAAELLRDGQPEHDIWLVHLTGEEFPADDLGARQFVQNLLESRRDIGGLVLMDMIGYRKRDDAVFQINAGESGESVRMALVAESAASELAAGYRPVVRRRFDPKSYLYNTDGIVFNNAGYPVILLNEHINAAENLNRPHYHATTDTAARLDFTYATAISKVAIETALRLARTVFPASAERP